MSYVPKIYVEDFDYVTYIGDIKVKVYFCSATGVTYVCIHDVSGLMMQEFTTKELSDHPLVQPSEIRVFSKLTNKDYLFAPVMRLYKSLDDFVSNRTYYVRKWMEKELLSAKDITEAKAVTVVKKQDEVRVPVPAKQQTSIFNFEDKSVRVIEKDGEPWFVAKDVTAILGYSNPSESVRMYCKCSEILKGRDSLLFTSSPRGVTIIPERDVYRLIMRSKLPSAERFEEWVVGEVLPSIRKTGSYTAPKSREYALAEAMLIANSVIEEQREQIEYQQEVIEELEPLADGYRTFLETEDTFSFQECARAMNIPGLTADRLTAFLRASGILTKDRNRGASGYKNHPRLKYSKLGWFHVVDNVYDKPGGGVGVNVQCRVTPKGQDEILRYIKHYLADNPHNDWDDWSYHALRSR